MNIYDKNSKQIATIFVHKASKHIIYNEGSGNILYKFDDCKKLLYYIEQKIGTEKRNHVSRELSANSNYIKQIIESKNKKSKTDKNQLSLF